MTDHDLATALQGLAASVSEHRVSLGREVATVAAKQDALQCAHVSAAEKLDRVLELELSCPARGGWEALGREMGETKKKISENRINVEAEMRALREDPATGQVDVAAARRAAIESHASGTCRAIAAKAVPYVVLGLIALGAWLATGGDEDATVRALRAVADSIVAIDTKVDRIERQIDTDAQALVGEGQ